MIFSDIVQRFDAPLNALIQECNTRRAKGQNVIDLVSGNVNRAGIFFPQDVLKKALNHGARQARIYTPNPLGQPKARESLSTYYREQGVKVSASNIVITPGTSVSYWYLFKLLANSGDEILCPSPSYPLLDSIAELCGVQLVNYPLLEKSRWEIDLAHLETQISPKTRAIVLISPHNPTGAVATDAEIHGLAGIAVKYRLPVISDEVFSHFLFTQRRLPRPANHSLPLLFTLSGVSKMFALPGLKIGWIAVSGEGPHVKKALHALDMISDTFLPVNEAAQFALPQIFKYGKKFLAHYQNEVLVRWDFTLNILTKVSGISFIRPEGGFYLTVRLASGNDEEGFALKLLKTDELFLHPGYFYDLKGSHLVFSYLLPRSSLQSALSRLTHHFK